MTQEKKSVEEVNAMSAEELSQYASGLNTADTKALEAELYQALDPATKRIVDNTPDIVQLAAGHIIIEHPNTAICDCENVDPAIQPIVRFIKDEGLHISTAAGNNGD